MKKFFSVLAVALLLLNSCSKDEQAVDPLVSSDKASISASQSELLDNFDKAAQILATFAGGQDVQKEVFEGVNMQYEKRYRILFKHLLQPEDFQRQHQRSLAGAFDKKFRAAIQDERGRSGKESNRGTPAQEDSLINYLIENNLEIYWPYSQEWDKKEIPTITYNPIDNEDENIGYKPRLQADGSMVLEEVKVDDDYAFAHPVWIIDQHESLPTSDPVYNSFPIDDGFADGGGNDGGGGGGPQLNPDGSKAVNKIFLYHIKTDGKNFRGLFGGENKMDIIVAGEQVMSGKTNVITNPVYIDRWAGRKGVWRNPRVMIDTNWKGFEISQWYGVKGIDIKKTVETKVSGSIKINKNGLEITPFAYEVTVKRSDKMLKEMNVDRIQFFHENWRDAEGFGTHEGRAVYQGIYDPRATIYFTLHVDAYNY